MAEERSWVADGRGVSEIAGVVLLLGLVVVGAAIVVLTGSAIQEGVTEQTRVDAATKSMQEVDAKLSGLSRESSSKSISLRPAPREGETVSVVNGDEMTITIRGDRTGSVTCTGTVALDALEYEGAADGTTLVYQAGAVWKRVDGATLMISPPGIGYRQGTLQFALVNLTNGTGSASEFAAERIADASQKRSEAVRSQLFAHDACKRPTQVRIDVRTRYPDAWERYLRDEMPAGTVTRPATDTVAVEVNDSELAREADDDRNQVVNFTNGDPDDGRVLPGDDGVEVDKSVSNTYDAHLQYVTARLGRESVDTSFDTETRTTSTTETHSVDWVQDNWDNDTVDLWHRYWDNETVTVRDNDTDLDGTPLDVEFVIDESGSMGEPCLNTGDCTQRIDYAKRAAKDFVETMPDAKARAGVVGYYDSSYTTGGTTLYQSLTGDLGTVDDSIEDLDDRQGATTPMGEGLKTALNDIAAESNPSHERVVVLLSDGKHNDGPPPMPQARRAAGMTNVTVYTVGVGETCENAWFETCLDQDLLQNVASTTGGSYYHVDDAANLESAFDAIYREVTNDTRTVVRPDTDREWITVDVDRLDEVAFEDTVTIRNETTRTVRTNVTHEYDLLRKPVGVSYAVGGGPEEWAFVTGSDTGIERAVSYAELFGTVDMTTTETTTVSDGQAVELGATAWDCASGASTDTGRNATNASGTEFGINRCTGLGGSTEMTVDVRVDGEPVPGDHAWWQSPLASRLPATYTDPSGSQFDLASNEVAVVVEGPGEAVGAMVFEMGDPDTVSTEWVIDLQVDVVDIEAGTGD